MRRARPDGTMGASAVARPFGEDDREGGGRYGRRRREDPRPPHAPRPDPSRDRGFRRRADRLRQRPAHRRGRLEGSIPARHAGRVLVARRTPLLDTRRGRPGGRRGFPEGRGGQGEGARGAEVGPEHSPAPRTARRDLRVLWLPEPRVGAEAWASPWRRWAFWPSRDRSSLDNRY